MRFLRHLAAAVLAVVVIIGLGMLWAHAAGGGGLWGDSPDSPEVVHDLVQPSRFGSGCIGDLIEIGVIDTLIATVVISVSVIRRRRRRRRRTRRADVTGYARRN